MNCLFIQNNKGSYTCEYCGFTFIKNLPRNCPAKKNLGQKEPNLAQKIINFTKAAINHAINGNPVVDEEVMKRRLKICKSCPLFKLNTNEVGGVCTHSSCGCTIQDNLNYLNKIAWADQKCPIDKWGEEKTDQKDSEGV